MTRKHLGMSSLLARSARPLCSPARSKAAVVGLSALGLATLTSFALPAHGQNYTLQTLASFSNASSEATAPETSLVDLGGVLYGTTLYGSTNGSTGYGTFYSYTASTGIQVLDDFNYTGDGQEPLGNLVNANGTLYGTALYGGSNTVGTIYSYTPTNGIQTLADFGGSNGTDPRSGLTFDSSSNEFYGVTADGGIHNEGTLYSFTPAGGIQTLVTFDTFDAVNTGSDPRGQLLDIAGTLYGTGETGGVNGYGTLFSYSTSGGFLPLFNFNHADGGFPNADLVDVNGTLYGTTSIGGADDDGTLFSYNAADGLQTLVNFDGTNGAAPSSLMDVAGTLFGTTEIGGTSNRGTVYSYTPSGGLNTLVNFNGTNGAFPEAPLTDINGILYGTTSEGGVDSSRSLVGSGTIFDLAPNGGQTAAVPEPSSFALLGLAAPALGLMVRRARRKAETSA